MVDIGGGAGYFTEAFVNAGARCVLVEPEAAGHPTTTTRRPSAGGTPHRRRRGDGPARAASPGGASRADTPRAGPSPVTGTSSRLPDGVVDVAFSSNVLEHVPDPARFLDEMIRVTRPGGIIYLSFTAWYSPWGGHETAPWHYPRGPSRRAAL